MIALRKGLRFFSDFKKFSPFKIVELDYDSKTLNNLTIIESPLLRKQLYNADFPLKNISGTQLKEKFRAISVFPQKIEASQEIWERFLREIKENLENKNVNIEIPRIISNYKDFTLFFSLFQTIRDDVLIFLQNINNSTIDNALVLEEFEHIFWINKNLNILDLPIWQQISLFLLKNSQFFSECEKFSYFFDRLLEYMSFFRVQPYKTFFFNENLLLHLYKRDVLLKLFLEIQSKFERLFAAKNFDTINNFIGCFDALMKITIKFKRVGQMDFNHFRTFLESLQKNLNSNDLSRIKIKNLLVFYRLFGEFGSKNENLFAKFNEIFAGNIKSLDLEDESFVLDCFLKNWTNANNYNEKLYAEYISPKLKSTIKTLKPLSNPSRIKAAKLIYDLILMNIIDKNILVPLLRYLNGNDYTKLPFFSRKALHTAFQVLLYIDENKTIDLDPFKEMINGLASMCIQLNSNKTLIKNTPALEKEEFIDCHHYQQIVQSKKTQTSHNLPSFEQNSSMSFQEKALFTSITKYVSRNLLETCEIYRDYQECLYKIDIALHFTKCNEKVAIELVGNPYSVGSGEFLAKKQVKFNLLEKFGWKIIVINISEQKYLNFFGAFNYRKSFLVIDEIFTMIEEKLQRKFEKKPQKKGVLQKLS